MGSRRPDPKPGELWRRKAGERKAWRVCRHTAGFHVHLIDPATGAKKAVLRGTLLSKYELVKESNA